jgi:HTH-type transcriptional regulator/antitoxin HipB
MPGMTPREIGAYVRRVRRAQGLRQDELAAAANVGPRFLVELEAGKPTVRLEKVLAVLAALGIEWVLRSADVPAGAATPVANTPPHG